MKSVGIITFHRPINYGAVLQALALCKAVEKIGYHAELIDYRFHRIEYYRKLLNFAEYLKMKANPKRLLKKTITDVLFFKRKLRERAKFDLFEKRLLPLSAKRYSSYDELKGCNGYDAYVVGSDLVWNTEMAQGVNPAYFLDFVKDESAPRLSYASSIGTGTIEEKYKGEYSRMLANLDSISVREKTSVEILAGCTEKKIQNVLDPTLLFSSADWNQFSSPVRNMEKPYVLVYMVEYSKALIECAQEIAKEKKLHIVHFNLMNYFGSRAKSAHSSSPEEFLWLFQHAECVITNSFHGCIFAIVNSKPLWCIPHTSRGARMIDLLSLLGIQSQIIYGLNDYKKSEMSIDYSQISPILDAERLKSYLYLETALSGMKRYGQ